MWWTSTDTKRIGTTAATESVKCSIATRRSRIIDVLALEKLKSRQQREGIGATRDGFHDRTDD